MRIHVPPFRKELEYEPECRKDDSQILRRLISLGIKFGYSLYTGKNLGNRDERICGTCGRYYLSHWSSCRHCCGVIMPDFEVIKTNHRGTRLESDIRKPWSEDK